MPAARPVCSQGGAACMEAVHHAHGRTGDHDGVQSEDGDGRGTKDLRETLADRGVPACLDQRALLLTTVPLPRPPQGDDGSNVGVPQLQPDKVVQHTAQLQSGNGTRLESPKANERGGWRAEHFLRKTGGPYPRNANSELSKQTCVAKPAAKHPIKPISSQLPVPGFPGFPPGFPVPVFLSRSVSHCPQNRILL